jgi:nickel-dependent lactate racemase
MRDKRVELDFGAETLALRVPEEVLAGPLVAPRRPADGGEPVVEALRRVLERPVGRPRLREMVAGRAVALVLSDEFRAGERPAIARALIAEIARGRPASVSVLVATGSHDPGVYGARVAALARETLADHGLPPESVWINDCDDREQHVELGRTPRGTPVLVHRRWLEAEVRVHGHEAKHHYMNGYSCFDKQVLPGLCLRASIEANHKLALDHRHARAGRSPWVADPERRFNPFAEDTRDARRISEGWLLRGGRLVRTRVQTFGLDMISERGVVRWAQAGDPDAVTRAMVGAADRLALFRLTPVRYVVVSPGGPPASQALYGVQNCFDMALQGAIQPGGEALVIAPCDGRPDLPPDVAGLAPDAKSKRLFWDQLVRFRDRPLEEWRRHAEEHFELYLWKTDRVLKLLSTHGIQVYLYSRLPAEILARAGFRHAPDPQAWIDERAARKDGLFRFINKGNKLLVMGNSSGEERGHAGAEDPVTN